MLRIVLLSLGAALLYAPGALAHEGHYESCAYGNTWRGPMQHVHPGGYGQAVPCGGGGYGGRYYEPAPRQYYRRGYGGGGQPGDYGPQTNRGQDCYNVGGQRICCPKRWTVQNGRCEPYRGY